MNDTRSDHGYRQRISTIDRMPIESGKTWLATPSKAALRSLFDVAPIMPQRKIEMAKSLGIFAQASRGHGPGLARRFNAANGRTNRFFVPKSSPRSDWMLCYRLEVTAAFSPHAS